MTVRDYQTLMRPRARWQWLSWFAAISLLSLAMLLLTMVIERAAQARSAEEAIQLRRSQRKPPPVVKASRADIEQQRRWTALSKERAYSWYPLLRALEQANSADIELLEFVPDKASGRVVLRGEARHFDALTVYLGMLGGQVGLSEVHLAHQKNINRAGMAQVAFEIRARTTIVAGDSI